MRLQNADQMSLSLVRSGSNGNRFDLTSGNNRAQSSGLEGPG